MIIKKYENRRLYNTNDSRYVNLDEVAALLQNGHDVKVVDASTGEDLTRLILTQIIVENAKGPESGFPLDVLRQMVVASGKATQENTLKYMKSLVEMYQSAFRAMSPALNPFDLMRPLTGTPPAPAGTPTVSYEDAAAPKPPQENADAQEVARLRQRLEEVEGMVAGLKQKKTSRPRKGSRSTKS